MTFSLAFNSELSDNSVMLSLILLPKFDNGVVLKMLEVEKAFSKP